MKAAGLSVLARRERVTGTGGKTGSMLPLRVGGQEALFVLSDVGQPAFTDGEQVTGVSTGEQWALAYDGPGGSCWETDVTFQNTNNKKDKSVVVTFPDASQVTLSFKDLIGSHSALDRKQRQQLKDGIAAAVAAFGDGDKLCMLRLRGWDYKSLMNAGGMTPPTVTLRLGDLDRMFTAPATELLGKQERLQALGMFNRPLSLRKRAYWQAEYDAAWDYSWEFAKTKLPGLDADPAGVLRRELARYLVDEGTLPSPGESKKVRRWAGFGPWFGKADIALRYGVGYVPDAPEHTFKMNAVRADLEAIYEHANPALGALPLAVEVKTGEEPIAGVQVWFELLAPAADRTPYDAAFAGRRVAGATSFVKGTGRPEAHASCVEWWTQRIYDHKANARQAGPQRQNVHFELGGKADMAPDGDVVTPVNNLRNVFSPPAGGGQAVLAKAYLPNQPNHVPNTAVAITDSNGVATVLFTPSAIGGERYRLRVTVRDPRDVAQVLGQAESGDMVVWRGFRVCAYYQRPAAAKERDITALVRQSIVEGRAQDNLKDLVGVLPTLDLKKSVQFEMAKAYCDVLIDDEGLAPRPLDAAYWTRYHDYIDQAYVANPDITRVPALSQRLAPYKVDLVSNDDLTFTGTLAPLPIRKGTVIILPRTAAEDKLAVAHDWQDGMDLTAGQADLVGVNLDDKVMGFATKMRVVANTTPIANGRIDYTTGAVTVTFQAAQVGAQFSAAWHPERPVDYRALHTHPPASPFLFSLVGRDEYNHLKGPSYPPADPINPNGLTVWQTLVGEVGEGSIAGTMLLRAASGAALEINGRTNGQCFAPGLIIIQAWRDNVYSLAGGDLGGKGVGNAALVYSGVAAKNKKALQAAHHHYLTLHEAGHAMYMIHAPQEAGSDSGLHSSNVDKHGCVMGGQDFDPKGARVNHGGFCGKCLANFAGVHIQEEPLRMERNTANQPIGNAPKGSIALARAQGIPGDIPDVDTHPVVTTVTTGGGTDEKPPLPPEEVRPNPDW